MIPVFRYAGHLRKINNTLYLNDHMNKICVIFYTNTNMQDNSIG